MEIRVADIKELPDYDELERQEILINAFLKGVNNRNAAKATEFIKPKSLEKAFNFIRNVGLSP